MERTHYSFEVVPKLNGEKVVVAGWVDEVRDLGGIKFIVLRDREGKIQITIPKKKVSEEILKKSRLSKESVVSVTGVVKEMKNAPNGIEIIPEEIRILGEAKTPLPLDISGKIESDLDTRLNARFMDLRNPGVQTIFRLRSKLASFIRDYYTQNGFVEIHTSKIVSAGAEGGSTLFPITYYDREAFLAQSPQLYKQLLMSTGLDRVFEIAPSYRAEESNTSRHLSEFWQLDVELAFISSEEDVMKTVEGVMESVLRRMDKECSEELKILGKKVTPPKLPFPRVTYSEALDVLSSKFDKKIPWGEDIDTESERLLGKHVEEKHKSELFFITKYPSKIKPFYIMDDADDPKLSRGFDLEYKGEELSSGGQREHREKELLSRMKEKGLNPENFEFYVDSFKYGMPPHGGYGIGLERILKLSLGLVNIREAVLFPRDMKRIVP